MVIFVGMSQNFWGLQVWFFIDLKVVSKKCLRLPYFTLLIQSHLNFITFNYFPY